ncbi:MAG: hypothetical protein ACHBN1_12625 [Heteroscytonema crispum UTEX LB 1556]
MVGQIAAVKQIRGLEVNQQGQTSFTIAIGTPGYMPREQAEGNPRLSSDIYAVGVIGIQAWTGVFLDPRCSHKLPKHPDTGEIIWRTQAQDNSKLADILDAMVRYHFNQRYPTAKSALQALQQLLSSDILEEQDTILEEEIPPTLPHLRQQKQVLVTQVKKPSFTPPDTAQNTPSKKLLIGGGIFATVAAMAVFLY